MYAKKMSPVVKPFCKVCFDANKPESQYTSHFVRKTKDLNSEILCPIILATECKYCHKLGHTISKCSLREKNNARHAHAMQAPMQRPMPAPAPAPVRGNNRYAVFEVEDEVEVEVEVEVHVNETEFPLLGGKSAAVQDTSRVSYAKAFASKPAQAQAQLTKPTPKNNTTKAANYHHYYSYIEDYSRSPNLEKWLSEPSIQQEQQEELAIGEKYRERLYEILYEYFKNEFHRERTSTVVDRLLDCSTKERLEEFMSNRLYLEDCADEIFMALREFDPPAQTPYREIAEDNDW